jgi:hypothetical protein
MQLKKVLFAGPWVGEFGWELFCWHAYVRSLSRFYDETVCVGPPHSKFMYEDFCDKYIGFTPNHGDYRDSFYKVGFSVDGPLIHGLMKEDNWKPLAESLLTKGYDIVSIGLKSESLHIESTTDKRECDQQELLDILHSGVAIFGPSSGAMHLASLCGCPQVVWTTDYNLERYTKNWNPFDTSVLFLSKYGWQPPPEYVSEQFWRFVNETD